MPWRGQVHTRPGCSPRRAFRSEIRRNGEPWRTSLSIIPALRVLGSTGEHGRTTSPPLILLIVSLVKLSVRRSGRHAATRLHRFLALGRCMLLPAYEITLLHGLEVSDRIDLGGKAYLAPYDVVRRRFGLEEYPEHWLTRSGWEPRSLSDEPCVTALVRRFSWGNQLSAGYRLRRVELPEVLASGRSQDF